MEPARWTIDQIAGLVPKPALDTPRHTILLMTGSRHGFTPAMFSSDSVHPNKSGYDFMGDTWYKTIGSLLH